MSAHFKTPRAFVIAGLVYLAVGFICLWMYIFVMLPLISARGEFEIAKAESEKIVSLRDTVRPLLLSDADGKPSPATEAGLKALQAFYPGLPIERAKALLGSETEIERLQERADEDFAGEWTARNRHGGAAPTTKPTDAKEAAPVQTATVPKPTPPSYLFLAWLAEKNERLSTSWLVRQHASSPLAEVTIKSFLLLGLALGLVLGSWRLLKLSRTKNDERRDPKFYLLPLVVPVIALLAVLLLTGFGPVFSSPVDPATNRFLMIMTAIIALAPDQFMLALRNYLVDTFKTMTPAGNGQKPVDTDED